jgi:tRNA pseudouridine55 synthase
MDGLIIIDKPSGPTSHDVVARLRRVLGERRIGHTGTLDPMATGVLPLVLGRATRLARFLSGSDKSYEAVIRLGVSTDTADAQGTAIGDPYHGPFPGRDAIDRALDAFRGTYLQQPPAFSAKKIDGQRSYQLARGRSRLRPDPVPTPSRPRPDPVPVTSVPVSTSDLPVPGPAPTTLPAPAPVTAYAIDIVSCDGDSVALRIDCSAGFYVRALAHDLGTRLGTGAHLSALRRTRSGDCALVDAIALATAEQHRDRAVGSVIAMSRMLPALTAVTLTADGVQRAVHGRDLGPSDVLGGIGAASSNVFSADRPGSNAGAMRPAIRLLDPAGELVGIAERVAASGLLHPSVVLL